MAWYNASWSHRQKITVDHTKLTASLTDFPVYVDLSTLPAAFFTNVLSTGADVRVTASDGTTECAIDLVAISTASGTGELHFKAPSLSSTADTDFYIYYGNASASAYAATATYGRNAVWSSYLFVAHMGSGTITDATGVNGDSTENGGSSVTGPVGYATSYSGSSQNTHWATATALVSGITSAVTWSAYVKASSWSSSQRAMEIQNQLFFLNFTGAGDQGPLIKQSGANHVANMGTVSTNTWHLLAAVFDGAGGTLKAYLDGTLAGTTSSLQSTIDGTSGGQDLNIGSDVSTGSSGSAYFNGYIDEVRVAGTARSADWIGAEYKTLSSPGTFYAVGSQEVNVTTSSITKGLIYNVSSATPVSITKSDQYTIRKTHSLTAAMEYVLGRWYGKQISSTLPATLTEPTEFTSSEYTAAATNDASYASVAGAGYIIEQFRAYSPSIVLPTITWIGKSSIPGSQSTIYLQLYNFTTGAWTTIASNSSAAADTDFTLSAMATGTASDYFDANGWAVARVYQGIS